MNSTKKHNTTVNYSDLNNAEIARINSTAFLYGMNLRVPLRNIRSEYNNQAINNFASHANSTNAHLPEKAKVNTNYLKPQNMLNGVYQASIINCLDNLSYNEPNETRTFKIAVNHNSHYVNKTNVINQANIPYTKNNLDRTYYGKNDDFNADRVALNMEIQKRVRENASRYINDNHVLDANYSKESMLLRNQIFDETFRVINEQYVKNDNFNQQEKSYLFNNVQENSQESPIQKANIQFEQKNIDPNLNIFTGQKTEMKLEPKNIDPNLNIFTGQKTEMKLEPKNIDPNLNIFTGQKTEIKLEPKNIDPNLNIFTGQKTEIKLEPKNIDPNLNIINNQKVDNSVNTSNTKNSINEKATSNVAKHIDLNQNFYTSNAKMNIPLTTSSMNSSNLNTSDQVKKYTREDSLDKKIASIDNQAIISRESNVSKESTENVNHDNFSKAHPLENILKGLTTELIRVNNPAPVVSKSTMATSKINKTKFSNIESNIQNFEKLDSNPNLNNLINNQAVVNFMNKENHVNAFDVNQKMKKSKTILKNSNFSMQQPVFNLNNKPMLLIPSFAPRADASERSINSIKKPVMPELIKVIK